MEGEKKRRKKGKRGKEERGKRRVLLGLECVTENGDTNIQERNSNRKSYDGEGKNVYYIYLYILHILYIYIYYTCIFLACLSRGIS